MSYIDSTEKILAEELEAAGWPAPEQDPGLLKLYTLLTLTKGKKVTLEDVHDAWSVWRRDAQPGHRSIVPFGDLSPDVQAMDQMYRDAIAKAACRVDE
ncbi:hypothetical protein ABT282_08020 [Streptomyces sp. NPDC000927]|uniref:DUF7701 domain-containing protein n=1 Tax=Streptomyces sp. NPDC000927 TaxID=3154371 RepID=UPI00331937AC